MKYFALLLFPIILLFSTPVMADEIVYITDSGEKYHSDGCQYLRSSRHAISLEEAVAQGYTPCSRCDPPRSESSSSKPQRSVPSYSSSGRGELAALQETIEDLQEEKSDLEDRVERLEEDLDDTKGMREENRELKNTLRDVQSYFQISIAAGAAASIFLFVQWYRTRRSRQATQEQLTRQLIAITEQLKISTQELAAAQAETHKFRSAYAQLKLLECSDIPSGIRFDEHGLPYTEPHNERYPWGALTVFRSKNGTRVHQKYKCCGATVPMHRYIAIRQKMTPCSKCWGSKAEYQLDDWYLQYIRLQDAELLTQQEVTSIPAP